MATIADPLAGLHPGALQQEQQFQPGEYVPVETGTPKESADKPATDPTDYGPNNEKLPEDLQQKLKTLMQKARDDGKLPRREEIRDTQKAHNFWKGLQYNWWDGSAWRLPNENKDGSLSSDGPRYQFCENHYQAFGLSLIAVLSQDIPPTRLWPQDPDQPEDVMTARVGQNVVKLFQRNNQTSLLMQEEAFHLFTGGKVGGYVRYVADGTRFGYRDQDDLGETTVKVSDDAYVCPICQAETPASDFMGICAECGAELSEENFKPAETAQFPSVTATKKVPNGAEVLSIIGGLELKTPPRMKEQRDFPYLLWSIEAHVGRLRAAFPHVADKIRTSGLGGGGGSQAEGSYDSQARANVSGGASYSQEDLQTFDRCWLRPEMFWTLENEENAEPGQGTRDKLLAIFPLGAYVAFAGDDYCESRNESMDDHWRVLHAMPGDGQNRPALGSSFISPQERINTYANIITETAEYGIPATFASSQFIDFEAFGSSVVEPGATYPISLPPGAQAQHGFYSTTPATVSGDVINDRKVLSNEIGQFLTGAFPALFGGDTGGNDTLGGIAIQRDQAMGRIGGVWRRMQYFHADLDLVAVNVFRKNRPDDVKLVMEDAGRFKSEWIRRADLKGNIQAFPDTDAQYPTTWSQQRAVYLSLLESLDPKIQAILSHPDNLLQGMRLIGLDEFVVPEEEAREKQLREIDELLKSGPIDPLLPLGEGSGGTSVGLDGAVGGQPPSATAAAPPQAPNPADAGAQAAHPVQPAGQPMAQPTPTVLVDEILDQHEVEFQVCVRWASSDAGQEAKIANPAGFANVRAHAFQHYQIMQAQMMAQAAMNAPAAEEKPGKSGQGQPPSTQQKQIPASTGVM